MLRRVEIQMRSLMWLEMKMRLCGHWMHPLLSRWQPCVGAKDSEWRGTSANCPQRECAPSSPADLLVGSKRSALDLALLIWAGGTRAWVLCCV